WRGGGAGRGGWGGGWGGGGGGGGRCRSPRRRLMSFWDMREWMTRLEKEGELRRITAEVDWDRELGAITRRVLEKKGPALLFESITGYTQGRCTKLFTSGLGSRARLARALGFPPDTSNAALVAHVMTKN